ncbi:MAG TPA: amidohydrolase [Bacillota bacterium]|nr:amidohydrolase [Bacillota bacterium]HPV12943.1 amidohydrolase [Bacillota bacterium]
MKETMAIVDATIYPVSSVPIENGILLMSGGKILQVGENVTIPQGATVIDAKGKMILPGFVDAHTHVGIWSEWYGQAESDGNEGSNPVTASVRAIDAVWPDHFAFKDARSGGVTCVQVTPGSGNVIGGETVVVKTFGTVVDDMVVRNPAGMKGALGENPKGSYGSQGKAPKTRMGIASILRNALFKAKDYLRKLEAGLEDPSKMPDTDLDMLSLVKVLKKEIPLRVHAHRADDIVTAVRIAEEFDIDYSIEHCTDGIEVADFLGKRKAKVNIGPTIWHRAKIETLNISPQTPGALSRAGCHVSIISDHPFHPIQHLVTAAAVAWANGMSEEDALKAITLNPAITLGVDDRVGSLEPGKDADFSIWTGHPFKIRSKIETVFIEGEKVFG